MGSFVKSPHSVRDTFIFREEDLAEQHGFDEGAGEQVLTPLAEDEKDKMLEDDASELRKTSHHETSQKQLLRRGPGSSRNRQVTHMRRSQRTTARQKSLFRQVVSQDKVQRFDDNAPQYEQFVLTEVFKSK